MTTTEFERLRREEPAFLLYFYGEHCSVCRDLYPKVRELFRTHFPRVRLLRIDAPASPDSPDSPDSLDSP